MPYDSIGARTTVAWEYEAMRDESLERAHSARMKCAEARFKGKLKRADELHNEAAELTAAANRYHLKAQDVRQTAIRGK